MSLFTNHNFSQAWHALTAQDPNHRDTASKDLAFWQQHAQGYDANASTPDRYAATLAAIRAYVRPTDTLLDVGAGSGRFAIPLANDVQHITALDHAAPMLDLLQHKQAAQQISNISIDQTTWESANVAQHDVVLAAWSLYRVPDILAAMHKLIATTRRTLIIVTSPGNAPDDTPMHLYFYGALWQAGVFPEIKIAWEQPTGEPAPQPVALVVWERQ